MKSILAIVFVSLYGISMRLLFAFLDNIMGIMSLSFMVLLPVVIGFLTVALLPKEKVKNNTSAFFKPWWTSLAILAATIIFNIEGLICWMMLFPLFLVLAGVGGMIAFSFKKKKPDTPDALDSNDWDQPNNLQISMVLLIPLFLGAIEGDRTMVSKEFTINKSVVIAASPTLVWQTLTHIDAVQPQEKPTVMANFFGFPQPLSTTLDSVAIGGNRLAVYEKGLYFEETITDFLPEKLLVLDIKTDPNKIPPTVMDEHIVIGGKHFDILRDAYTLEPLPDGQCRLQLSSRYTITTPFNWYAGIWTHYLMADMLQGELEMIKQRAAAHL